MSYVTFLKKLVSFILHIASNYFIFMNIEEEVRDAIKKRNNKKVESIFSKHLNSSFSTDLYLEYLSYVNSTNKDVLKEAVNLAYNRTLYNINSVDIKIRYLEILMEDEESEKVKEVYTKIVQTPLLKIDTIIELYKNYETTKNRTQKKETDLLSKEVTAVEESKKLQQFSTPMQLVEYIVEQYKNKYTMYGAECVLYNIDCAIHNSIISSRNRGRLYLYKILLLSKEQVEIESVIDKYSRGIVLSKGVSEKNEKIEEMLWAAIRSTSDVLPLLFILSGYSSDISKILEIAPCGISRKSESFYLIFFSGILKTQGIEGMRKYLIKLAKEKKIGSLVYNYCATVEGLIGGGNRYAGGIFLTAFKMFLNSEIADGDSAYYITPQENAYRLVIDGTKLLLSLGDVQRAHMLIDLYNREAEKRKFKKAHIKEKTSYAEEKDPKLIMVKHQILYESGLAAVLSVVDEYKFSELFELLCRVYRVEEEEEVKLPFIIKKLIETLPKISENQNIFSRVDLSSVVSLLVNIEV